ncbi:MAG: ATP-binding cassette domain-containing protein [candidate division Zixibacteria bacterium]|nr:ATP-binding cassette domain-containing protein [candidate division Zixibacteria bacterium]
MIEVVDLHKAFGSNNVLKGANLKIEKGETLTIIGRSGVGKSVLLKHIVRLLEPDSGYIQIDGENILDFDRKQLMAYRRRFGMLFQGAALFDSMTVDENVGLSLREHTNTPEEEVKEIVSEKLRVVGMKGIENLKPAELSGGMKKRVGLARAISMNPEFILYDEPTTGLDPIMADAINDLIIRLREELNVTSIAVTHDMTSAYKISDRIAMIYEGEIIFAGTPDEVKNTDNPVVQQFIRGEAEGPIKAV